MKLTTHLHLVPSSRMHRAIPPFPQYVFMTWCLAKHRDNFTVYLYIYIHKYKHTKLYMTLESEFIQFLKNFLVFKILLKGIKYRSN